MDCFSKIFLWVFGFWIIFGQIYTFVSQSFVGNEQSCCWLYHVWCNVQSNVPICLWRNAKFHLLFGRFSGNVKFNITFMCLDFENGALLLTLHLLKCKTWLKIQNMMNHGSNNNLLMTTVHGKKKGHGFDSLSNLQYGVDSRYFVFRMFLRFLWSCPKHFGGSLNTKSRDFVQNVFFAYFQKWVISGGWQF